MVFPQVSGLFFDEGLMVTDHMLFGGGELGSAQHNVSTFLSSFGVGEIQMYKMPPWLETENRSKLAMQFVYGGKVLWSECREFGRYGTQEPALKEDACQEVLKRLGKLRAA
jgi:hypothetical protein